jgi:hypothetical protein
LLGAEGLVPQATVVQLPPAASVVFVTDGLVERRDRSLDVGLRTMVDDVRGRSVDDVEATCQILLDRCRPARGHAH